MEEKTVITNQTFDAERALYGSVGTDVTFCRFEGPADGESALKESRDVTVKHSFFDLRYPFWHDTGLTIEHSELTPNCRAALWYDKGVSIVNSDLHGIKAMRESSDIRIADCDVVSAEFGWNCNDITLERVTLSGDAAFMGCRNLVLNVCSMESPRFGWNCTDVTIGNSNLTSEYFLFGCRNVRMDGTTFKGKYSFQYVRNMELHNCVLDTKDAFWHTENVTVYDSVIKGEYLAWYSKNLRLVRCRISGTQPLCYCENLILEDCTMEGCDLSFEYCTVNATVKGHIDSVKNPIHGSITADSIGEIIRDENEKPESDCRIIDLGRKEE